VVVLPHLAYGMMYSIANACDFCCTWHSVRPASPVASDRTIAKSCPFIAERKTANAVAQLKGITWLRAFRFSSRCFGTAEPRTGRTAVGLPGGLRPLAEASTPDAQTGQGGWARFGCPLRRRGFAKQLFSLARSHSIINR
jgi:hypothetical protein